MISLQYIKCLVNRQVVNIESEELNMLRDDFINYFLIRFDDGSVLIFSSIELINERDITTASFEKRTDNENSN